MSDACAWFVSSMIDDVSGGGTLVLGVAGPVDTLPMNQDFVVEETRASVPGL
jgi:hypothetical protein